MAAGREPRSTPRRTSRSDADLRPQPASRSAPPPATQSPSHPGARANARASARLDPRIAELQSLARRRKLPETARAIGDDIEPLVRRLRNEDRRIGRTVAAWTELLPATVLARCRIDGLRAGGVLAVTVDGSSTHWALDRLLREGGQDRLRAATAGAVQRVRIRVGVLEDLAPEEPRRAGLEDGPFDEDA